MTVMKKKLKPKKPDDPGHMRGWNNAGKIIEAAKAASRSPETGSSDGDVPKRARKKRSG